MILTWNLLLVLFTGDCSFLFVVLEILWKRGVVLVVFLIGEKSGRCYEDYWVS